MIKKNLILSADEHTWPQNYNDPVIFLGEWCKLYSRKSVWQKYNYKVASYHWDDRQKLFKDYLYIEILYEELLLDLSKKLNYIHSVNHSLRYWRILIGPWLINFISILFDRWSMLKQTIDKEKIIECTVKEHDPISLVANDFKSFSNLLQDDEWQEGIYAQLLELLWRDKINIIKIAKTKKNNKTKDDIRPEVKTTFKTVKSLLSKLFIKDNSYFLISTYLTIPAQIKLQIMLGQFPCLWQRIQPPYVKPDIHKRTWDLNAKSKDNSFENVVRKLISYHIPTVYLEGYKKFDEETSQINWPQNPKAIFTSNSYNSDDFFKKWTAEKIEKGIPLIIAQHGGNYGMSKFSMHDNHPIKIADKFLSWGWSDNSISKIKPLGNIKMFNKKKVAHNSKGVALMVQMSIERYSNLIFSCPISSQFLDYQDDQENFLKILPQKIRKQVLIKLYKEDYGWNVENRWKDKIPEVKIETSKQNIFKFFNKSRIYISTYNATTYLESLFINMPTIVFWNPKHWELRKDAIKFFDIIKSAGIFHETPSSAAQQLVKIWDDVDSWWFSEKVQNARIRFCKQYSKSNTQLTTELARVLKSS